MKRVIRLGDPTSHGGTVVSASSTVNIKAGSPSRRLGHLPDSRARRGHDR